MDWESFDNGQMDRVFARNGWFVRTWAEKFDASGNSLDWWPVAMVFMPDPERRWVLEDDKRDDSAQGSGNG